MPKTITAYTFQELEGDARERALRDLPPAECEWTLDECMDSLKALCKHAGVTIKDYSIGPYSYSRLKVEINDGNRGYEVEEMTNPRAFAWIENNIFGPLRQSWNLKAKNRKYYKPEHVPACPFTGVCFDEDLLDVFRDRNDSRTLKERFEGLADVISRICESELEYQDGEGREERAECYYDGALFTKDGSRIQ